MLANSTEEQIAQALNILFEASLSSQRCDRNRTDFAVEINELTDIGIAKHVLMHLICQNEIIHFREITTNGQTSRKLVPQPGIVLSSSSCFVLSANTEKNLALDNLLQELPVSTDPTDQVNSAKRDVEINRPVWDTARRELRINDIVVKYLRWPASNQETVLEAFSKLNWPCRIDDPLPLVESICPKRRLHDTIKCLNRKQKYPIIKFRGDGTGRGVILQIVEEELEKALEQTQKSELQSNRTNSRST